MALRKRRRGAHRGVVKRRCAVHLRNGVASRAGARRAAGVACVAAAHLYCAPRALALARGLRALARQSENGGRRRQSVAVVVWAIFLQRMAYRGFVRTVIDLVADECRLLACVMRTMMTAAHEHQQAAHHAQRSIRLQARSK